MYSDDNTGDDTCAVYVDMGTTNTRVWLVRGDEVVSQAKAQVGVGDTARDGSPERIRGALRDLIAEVRTAAATKRLPRDPSCVVAAGMITSAQGLLEVLHVAAPAGLAELAASAQLHSFPDVVDLPVLLIPGVRSGSSVADMASVGEIDVVRGEEVLCVGLVELGLLQAGATLLNLGSHWKAIRLDDQSRIRSSFTTLSGEMIYAVQTQTVLASAVPHERPTVINESWLEAGMIEQRRSGLTRALFCVRLLEQGGRSTPEERLAFLVGAFISSDMDAMMTRDMLADPVVITGGGVVAEAWRRALSQVSINAFALDEVEIERAFLAGLRLVGLRAAPMLLS